MTEELFTHWSCFRDDLAARLFAQVQGLTSASVSDGPINVSQNVRMARLAADALVAELRANPATK